MRYHNMHNQKNSILKVMLEQYSLSLYTQDFLTKNEKSIPFPKCVFNARTVFCWWHLFFLTTKGWINHG